jgi:hypothetical protein
VITAVDGQTGGGQERIPDPHVSMNINPAVFTKTTVAADVQKAVLVEAKPVSKKDVPLKTYLVGS